MAEILKDILVVSLLCGIFFGCDLGNHPLAAPDGARYAEIPREMVVTGDYVTPRLNGIKYFEKPPLFYWLQAASIKALGTNELSVNLTNMLLALGTVILIYLTSRILYGRLAGFLATAVYATSALVFALTRVVTLDVALTFFLTGTLTTFILATSKPPGRKRRILLAAAYFFVGCAVMTKGLVGMLFPGIIMGAWLIIAKEWRNWRDYYLIDGLIIFLLVTLPWHILVQLRNPEFFKFYFIEQHFLRYFTDYAHRQQKWWFFPSLLLAGLYPWVTFLPQTLINSIKKLGQQIHAKQTILLLFWSATIYLFYSFSNSKLIPYILPIFPSLAMLLSHYLAEIYHNQKSLVTDGAFYALVILNITLAMAAVAAIFIMDFSKHAITAQNLMTVSALMLISGLLLFYYYRTRGIALGLVTIAITTSLIWLYISPKISTINRKSIKPLIVTLQKNLQPGNEVICYGNYYQDLPFYLGRIVTVANFVGELEFGMKHQDVQSWMINKEAFYERWREERTIYMIISENHYDALLTSGRVGNMMVADKLWDTLLVVNR